MVGEGSSEKKLYKSILRAALVAASKAADQALATNLEDGSKSDVLIILAEEVTEFGLRCVLFFIKEKNPPFSPDHHKTRTRETTSPNSVSVFRPEQQLF